MRVAKSLLLALACAGCTPLSPPEVKLSAVELAAGAPEAALRAAQAAVQANPNDPAAWAATAAAQAALGQNQAAQDSYRHAIAENPADLDARLGLARLRLSVDALGSAQDLQALADQHPHDARIWTDLGVALDLQLRPAAAQQAYRRAIAENPLLVSAQADLGVSLALSGRAHDGAAMLGPLANGPTSTARLRQDYAFALALAGDASGARGMLSRDLSAEEIVAALDQVDGLRDAPH